MTKNMYEVDVVQRPMALTGEAPFWDTRREKLWWIDIQGQRLFSYAPHSGNSEMFATPFLPGLISSFDDDRLIIGLENGLWTFVPEQNKWDQLSTTESDRPDFRLNDGKMDSKGRLWFGSMDIHGRTSRQGRLYCRQTDGTIDTVLENITIPNAICITGDGTKLLFADSPTRELCLFDITDSPTLENRTVIKTFDAGTAPDGACLTSDQTIWVAVIGAGIVENLSLDGTVLNTISLPVSRPTMPMIGGRNQETLFVTSQRRFLDITQLQQQPDAGNLIAIDLTTLPSAP